MTTIGSATTGTAWFLNGISNLQAQEAQTQRELSSGYRINDASDSPAQTPQLIQLGSTLASVQAYQTNLGNVQAEESSADQSIGPGLTFLAYAESLAAQGGNTTATATTDQALAIQVQGIQQQLVTLANTTVQGRYIFGGDQDQSAPYQYDSTSATGVDSLTVQVSSRVIVNTQGQQVYQGLTAQLILDAVDADGSPSANITFDAVHSLQNEMQAGEQVGNHHGARPPLQSRLNAVRLNQQQAYYGAAEQRITNEQNNAANQITALQTQISNIRDADPVPGGHAIGHQEKHPDQSTPRSEPRRRSLRRRLCSIIWREDQSMANRQLTQHEIDTVFQSAQRAQGNRSAAKPAIPVDFRRPDRIARSQLRAIHQVHENFCAAIWYRTSLPISGLT